MKLAWESLAASRPEWHLVLRLKADHQDKDSATLAVELSARVGKPLTASNLRQQLHRARKLFARLLLDAVAQTLGDPTRSALEEELRELSLWDYCRDELGDHSGG